MDINKLAIDLFRVVLFWAASVVLSIIDFIFNIIKELISLNTSDVKFVYNWWSGLCFLITFLIIVRISFKFFVSSFDEEALEKISFKDLLQKIILIVFVVGLLPFFTVQLGNISSNLTLNISKIVNVDIDSLKPSDIMVSGLMNTNLNTSAYPTEYTQIGEQFNAKEVNPNTGKKEYVYANGPLDLGFLLIGSFFGAYIFFMISVQIGQRYFGIILKILISPYPISGIVDKDDQGFNTWTKLIVADYVSNFVQMLAILLALTLVYQVPASSFVKIILLLASGLSIMNAPSGIAQLIGSDIGTATSLQQMQTMTAMNAGTTAFAGTMATAGAFGASAMAYGAGRAMGGGSIQSIIGAGGNKEFYRNSNRENSFASRFADRAENSTSTRGKFGRAGAKLASAMYNKAGKTFKNKPSNLNKMNYDKNNNPAAKQSEINFNNSNPTDNSNAVFNNKNYDWNRYGYESNNGGNGVKWSSMYQKTSKEDD